MDYKDYYSKLVKVVLNHNLNEIDGVNNSTIISTEKRLGNKLPEAIRQYYFILGNLKELNELHDRFYKPEELCIQDGYLWFMEENQAVACWGIMETDLDKDEPNIWQGVNSKPMKWYSEDLRFTEFIYKRYSFVSGQES